MSAATLLDTLRRAAAVRETRRVPDTLRAEDVDKLYFSMRPNNGFRIVPEGLRNALWRPRIEVEGRGRVLHGANQGSARIYFEVGLDAWSLVRLGITFALIVILIVLNLVSDSPSWSSFWVLFAFGGLIAGLVYIHGRALVERAWPGLLTEVRRLADGSLYVPSA